jgi:hypothetical protein
MNKKKKRIRRNCIVGVSGRQCTCTRCVVVVVVVVVVSSLRAHPLLLDQEEGQAAKSYFQTSEKLRKQEMEEAVKKQRGKESREG